MLLVASDGDSTSVGEVASCAVFSERAGDAVGPVSYTHLTLPTSDLVEISVVAVSLKKKNEPSKWSVSRIKRSYVQA